MGKIFVCDNNLAHISSMDNKCPFCGNSMKEIDFNKWLELKKAKKE